MPSLLLRVGILYFIALECSRVLQRSINPGLLKRGSVGFLSSIDLGSPRDAILCIVHAQSMIHTIHSRYIPSYELWYIPSYQESSHNKLTTDRRNHPCRYHETNWASLPWGFETINKLLAWAYLTCASILESLDQSCMRLIRITAVIESISFVNDFNHTCDWINHTYYLWAALGSSLLLSFSRSMNDTTFLRESLSRWFSHNHNINCNINYNCTNDSNLN